MIKQLTLQGLRADLGAAERMLESARQANDVIGQFQFKEKIDALRARIAELGDVKETVARVALFFGGRPVLGSRGIDAAFSSHALESFQTLLSKQFAWREKGALGARGTVPALDESRMIVTDVARGSVGFVMEEAPVQGQMVTTDLNEVIEELSSALFQLSGEGDEWSDVLGGLDERVIGAIKSFFAVLDDAGASVRIVEGDHDRELTQAAVRRARARTDLTNLSESDAESIPGQIVGITSKTFEFIADTGERYSGRVADGPARQLEQAGNDQTIQHLMFAPVKVHLKVRTVTTRGWSRTYYTLIGVESRLADGEP
ncbi:hypothetical protein [Luteibacter sp.]|uniref:hypothetical protein n=1 Tax=Luteibacter sp. TaxID=1886636 RepID=UPI003F80DAC6